MDWHGEEETQANVQESAQPPRQPPEPIQPSAQSPHTQPPQFASGTDLVSQANLQDSTKPLYKPPVQIDVSADMGNVTQENKVPRTADKLSDNPAAQSETPADMASFTEEKKFTPNDAAPQKVLQNSEVQDHLDQNKALIQSGLNFLKLIEKESCDMEYNKRTEKSSTVARDGIQREEPKPSTSDIPKKVSTKSEDLTQDNKVTRDGDVKQENQIIKEETHRKPDENKHEIHKELSSKMSSKLKVKSALSRMKRTTSKESDSGSDDLSDSSCSEHSPFSEPLVLKDRETENLSTMYRHDRYRSPSEDSDRSFHREEKKHERDRYGHRSSRYSEERCYRSSDSENSCNARDKEIRSRTKNKRRRYSSESSSDSEERHGSRRRSPVKDLREKISSKRKSERKRSRSKEPKKRDKEKTGIKLKLFIKDKQFNCAVSTKTSSESSESNVIKKSKDKKKKKKHKSKHEAETTSTANQKVVSPIKIKKKEEWKVSRSSSISRKRSRSPSSSRSDSPVSPVLPKRAKIQATSSKLPSSDSGKTVLSNVPQSKQMSVNGQYHRSIADDPVVKKKALLLVDQLSEQHEVSTD